MRFLFLTTRYSADPADPYMTDELAEGLIARGHCVDVLLIDWDAPLPVPTCEIRGSKRRADRAVAPRALRSFGRLVFRASKLSCPLATRRRDARPFR